MKGGDVDAAAGSYTTVEESLGKLTKLSKGAKQRAVPLMIGAASVEKGADVQGVRGRGGQNVSFTICVSYLALLLIYILTKAVHRYSFKEC